MKVRNTDNIYDYVKWMGGFTFEEKAFNDVDALVLSTLVYYDFSVKKAPDAPMTLRETYRRIRSERGEPPFYTALHNDLCDEFCEIVAKSVRYGSTLVKNYTEKLDHENAVQFVAVTFEMPRLFNFIAYRGTDDTLAGWKEDFMISFTRTQSQELALQYACDNLLPNTVNMIGGHSKGANLALYAAAYLKFDLWENVNKVYLLDGPGFCPEVLDVENIEKVNRRAVRIVPEFCLIGKLFEPKIDDTVIIKSSGNGLLQHDLFTWGVSYGELLTSDHYDEQSLKMSGLIDRWISNMGQDERKTFVNELFDALASDGALTVSDIMDKGLDSLEGIAMKLMSGSHTTRKAVASLPEQALFGNAISSIRKIGLIQWLGQCQVAKNLVLLGTGLFFVLASDRALEITAMVFFLALTAIELVLTIRRLYQAEWKFSMIKERVYLLASLIAICIVIVVKKQALFMIGSILCGIIAIILAFRQMSKATDKQDDTFMRVVHAFETLLLFVYGICFLVVSSDMVYDFSVSVGIVLMVDGAVRMGYRIYRQTHPAVPKPTRERRAYGRRRRERRK